MLAIALMGATVLLAMGALQLGSAVTARQRIIGAADTAALAAADGASGAIGVDPCGAAADVARGNGATLTDCLLDGLVATVTVSGRVGLMGFTARSTAGPPP